MITNCPGNKPISGAATQTLVIDFRHIGSPHLVQGSENFVRGVLAAYGTATRLDVG
jgi:hypothetical protein